MELFEITAEVTMHIEAESEEDAIEMAESELSNAVSSWEITNVN